MSSSKHNPFDKEVRGLGHYEKLSRDLNERSDNLLNSLPLFWRSVLIEKSAGWYKEFNRYDLLAPFPVHADFPKLTRLTRAIEVCTTIYAKSRSITEREFRNASIVALNGTLYTVQDFVLSIGYNGGLHWKPTDDKIRLKKLYEEFIEKYPETAFQIVVDITSCLVTVFEEVYNKFTGDNNAYCTVYGCQPMIVKKGNIIRNGKGDTSLLFSNS
ncbi:MAG: hypothetical protein IH820_17150, partial [Bacteroidetes bacterium]|nr:hypothetical protein [Bacteroidota bacterium]